MGIKVLVADDSGVMRKIIIRSLASLGVTDVVEAPDGNDGWTRFSQQTFDLVLTDWNMPGKTGLELLKDIRNSGSRVPVILITTEGEKTRVMEAIHAGVSDYIIKPFDVEMLRNKLEKYLSPAAV